MRTPIRDLPQEEQAKLLYWLASKCTLEQFIIAHDRYMKRLLKVGPVKEGDKPCK